ncbi:FAD-binding domain-containing protein [Pannonibacter phragmitetus]|uniref:FAD-binding domain-containing protein n=1 Tax=Pannonibacter phragmitetus TaxID=121719 RepID=UPI000F015E50|nr:FAD-binding domain-containing protein [Pannonibacter phragmitetus]
MPPAPATAPTPSSSLGLQVVWFKRDLRAFDHQPLFEAARLGLVLPLYIVEPGLWAQPDMSGRQFAFLRECLEELREVLARLGQPLIIRTGEAVPVLSALHRARGIAALWSHEETGNLWTFRRDLAVKAFLRAEGIPWHEPRQTGVVRRLASRNGWAARWDHDMRKPLLPEPLLTPLSSLGLTINPCPLPPAGGPGLAPDLCPQRQPGGRKAGLACLESFLHRRGKTYRSGMSSPVSGFDACSRLSPHIAFGTLSLREITQRAEDRLNQLVLAGDTPGAATWRGAVSSFLARLHWHCHFMQKLEDAPRIEVSNLHPAHDGLRPREPDRARLEAWMKGETGLPFVDATMRALLATGWMNFRMRAMLMAVSSYHLWLDWRTPGEHLARCFTDYEPGIHWPQVQMQSGTTGINTIRIYNPVKQGLDQDPDGRFIRRWVPELRAIPDAFLHEPWKAPNAGAVLDKAYPLPVVDHVAAAREARDKVWSLRKDRDFHKAADTIQERHGSRKSGITRRGRDGGGGRKRPADTTAQLSFGLLLPQEEGKGSP